ncbi:hypothetical protein GF415_05510 [Candidatus Micrarchaeota archaeon]|nr:hypothetical protein [Candidatus Micrarchaeota archaeon]
MQKLRGLMFRKKVVPIFFDFFREGVHPIHSFFVPSPFFAVYLSSAMGVVDKFRVSRFELLRKNQKPARYLIELGEKDASFFGIGDEVAVYAGMEDTG